MMVLISPVMTISVSVTEAMSKSRVRVVTSMMMMMMTISMTIVGTWLDRVTIVHQMSFLWIAKDHLGSISVAQDFGDVMENVGCDDIMNPEITTGAQSCQKWDQENRLFPNI